MAELAGGRSILFGSGAPESFARQSEDMFRMSDPRRFEQGEMDRSLRELAGCTVPLKLELFQGRADPKAAWRGIVLGVQSFKSNLSEHNVAYITEDKHLGIAFPEHVEVVTPKGLGNKRQTHMEIVGQQITNTMEHAMLVGLAKKHLERGKPLDMKWLQDTFRTTSVEGLKDIMELDQHALKKHMSEAWVELAFGKMLQPIKDTVNPIKEKIVATRNAVTAKLEQMAERKVSTKQKAVSIAGIIIIGSPLVAGCVPTTMTPETPMIPPATEVPTTPPLVPTESSIPTAIPVTNPTETGPESSPEASVIYPRSLSVEQVKQLLEQKPTPISDELWNDPGVIEIVTRHLEWVRQAGFDFAVVPVATVDGHWFIELQYADESIAGWLKIADTSSQSGWRYGEQPTYDSQFKPSQDKFTFGLPALHNPDNHFEILYQGFPILVEMSADGEPQYWNNIVAKEMQKVEGVTIVEPEFKAGILETLAECNTLELQYLPDGSIDLEWMKGKMRELSLVEHAWLTEQGITIEDIAGVGRTDITGGSILPYPRIEIVGYPILPVSCTTITDASGQEYQVYGFAVKAGRENSNSIAILHILYDHVGQKTFGKDDNYAIYNKHLAPEVFFKKVKDELCQGIYVFINGYGQNDDIVPDWKMTEALIQMQKNEAIQLTNPQEQGATPTLMFFLGGKYKDIIPSVEEEAQWASIVEEYIYPSQSFTILK